MSVETVPPDLGVILACLQTMRAGDFSVRLPGSWTGLAGKIADTFNDIVAVNQQMAQELNRVGQVVGKEGTRELGLQPRQKLNRLSQHVIRDPGILGEPAGPGSGAMVCPRSFRIGDEVNPDES